MLPSDHPRRPGLLADLGQALMERGELRDAEQTLSEAVELATAFTDRTAEAHARLAGLGLRLYTDPEGKTDEIRAEVERVLPVFDELGDERGLAAASLLLAEVDWMRSRYASVEEHLERTIAHAQRAGDRAIEIRALARLAPAVLFGPTRAEAGIRRCREISERARGHPRVEASVLCVEAELRAMLGRFEGTREQVGRARGIFDDLGLAFMSTMPSEALAFVEMLEGDPAAAERELRWGYQRLEEMGERGFLSTAAAELARAVAAQGRLDEAERFAEVSLETSASDDAASRVPATSVLARARAARGEAAEAERLARWAVERAAATDDLVLQGDALSDLADVLLAAGRADEAAEALGEAAARYEQKGNVVSARKAQRARDRVG
jgi:tetratricopeptide (TPR) repeat protein